MFRIPAWKSSLFVRSSSLLAAMAVFCLMATPVRAATIPVPNGDFSNSANFGSVGGGLFNLSSSSQIGNGPWSGNYSGAFGLLAPPTLTISNGAATISSVAGINWLGIVNNGGYFSQTLSGQNYSGNTLYTLMANVNAGTALGLSLLQNSGVGIALTSNGTVVSSTASSSLISVNLLSGNTYQVQLGFQTGATAPSGNIGIQLFDQPAGLLTANLLSAVTFSNVSLSATAVPEPTSFGLLGIGLTTFGWFGLRRRRSITSA